jgi:hypothetical protein
MVNLKELDHLSEAAKQCSFCPVMFTIDQISRHIVLDIKEGFRKLDGGTANERNSH